MFDTWWVLDTYSTVTSMSSTHAQTLPPLFAKVLAPRVVRHSTILMVVMSALLIGDEALFINDVIKPYSLQSLI